MVGTARKNENSAADVRVSFETFHPQCWRHFEKLKPLRGIGIIHFECRQISDFSPLNDCQTTSTLIKRYHQVKEKRQL
jgi:hypothetical protein